MVTASRDELGAEMKRREIAELGLREQWGQVESILEGLPHILYVSDPNYARCPVRQSDVPRDAGGGSGGGDPATRRSKGSTGPCSFCTNEIILKTREPHTWEHYNPILGRHFLITDRIIPWSGGVEARLEIAMDVTQRKEAEYRLEHAVQMSESIIESLPGAFYQISRQGAIVRWNRRFSEVTGYSDQEIAVMDPRDFFFGEDKDRAAAAIARTFEEGNAEATVELVDKNGERIPYLFTGMRKVIDGEPCLLGMGTDVSELRKAHLQLERSMGFPAAIESRTRAVRLRCLARTCRNRFAWFRATRNFSPNDTEMLLTRTQRTSSAMRSTGRNECSA